MYKIGEDLVISNTIKRKKSMLTYLLDGPKTIQSISKHIKASEKTVRRLLSDLKKELPNEIKIEILRSSVLILNVSDYFVFSSLLKSWAGDSPLFSIVESLFYNEKLTIPEYSDQLFLSETTTRNYFKILKNILAEYNLKLDLSPVVKLTGDEVNIRYFFFYFFNYSGELVIQSPRYKENAKGVYNYLDHLALEYQIPLYIDYSRLLIWIFVIETRLSQNSTVMIDDEIINFHWKTTYFQNFLKAFKRFFSSNEIWKNQTKSELVYAYVTRLSTLVYEDSKVYFMEEYFQYLEPYQLIVSDFFEKYKLNRVAYSELEFKLKAFLANLHFLSEITNLHQRVGVESNISKSYIPIYNLWRLLLESSDWKFKDDIAKNLTYLTCTSLMKREYKYKNILFVLTGEPVLIPYYKEILHQLLPQGACVNFLFNKPVSNELLQSLEIDIIVSNIYINVNEINLENYSQIRLSDNPDEWEWSALVEKIYHI
ncbi:helix-turn-helix domain-containing protein [Enterococcus casseliflavus]|nr:helix-turn-helix domain-containing protein [Enterococcus casseliflavus]